MAMMNEMEYRTIGSALAGGYRAAVYCRLSKDDDLQGESASIANQRDMLEKYCEKQGWEVVAVYQDDGFTGLNMERPDLQRMLRAIERRQINLVITKDLSRLGRNYLQTGHLIEDFFPRNGVRYIAMNDGIDTLRDNNDIAPFKNILNEMYSKDISKKVHSSYLLKAQKGQFTGCLAPFGYRKDPEDKNHLLIDEETAPIVVNMADTKRKLDNDVFATAGFAQKNNCALTRLDYLQEAGFMSSIPLGENLIPIQRGLTTSSTAIFIPFITQELFQRGAALYYGLNALSNNMILCDRKKLKNPNGLILGTPGSGKSFAAKREMTNAFLITDDDIIICDPEAEYFSLVQRLGGQVIRLSPAGKGMDGKPQYVNPMDINLNYSEDDNPLALKSDFILSLCELVIGGKEGLQPIEKTVIDRAVRNVYRPFLAEPDPAKMPILGDLYNELLKQPEPEAARIAAALELYVSGSLNVFNHRTNVELSNRLVCFDIKQLGKQLKKLGMLIVQDQVWNRVTVNRAEKKATRYYMDEFHLLLKEEQTAAYSVEIWKRFRKWGGIPTAITQNVKDLLSSREVENIFENSDFVLMLNQAQGDRAILAKQLNISPQQMKYVTHTEAGEGLIFYGNVVLPFIDRFPTDTELYRLLTTKPEEVSKP